VDFIRAFKISLF